MEVTGDGPQNLKEPHSFLIKVFKTPRTTDTKLDQSYEAKMMEGFAMPYSGQESLLCIMTRFLSDPLIVRVPFFIIFGSNTGTIQSKGQNGTTQEPRGAMQACCSAALLYYNLEAYITKTRMKLAVQRCSWISTAWSLLHEGEWEVSHLREVACFISHDFAYTGLQLLDLL